MFAKIFTYAQYSALLLFVSAINAMDDGFTITFPNTTRTVRIEKNLMPMFPFLNKAYNRGEREWDTGITGYTPNSINLVVQMARFQSKINAQVPIEDADKAYKRILADYSSDDRTLARQFAGFVDNEAMSELIHTLTSEIDSQKKVSAAATSAPAPQKPISKKNGGNKFTIGQKNYFADTLVPISFPDDATAAPASYPLFQIVYANTLKDLIESFDAIPTTPIPVQNTSQKDFELLLEIIHSKKLGFEKPSAVTLEKTLEELIARNPNIDFGKMLRIADYLNVDEVALDILQKGYVSSLKGSTYIPLQNSFDNFPVDWQRSIAGKLLHNLLEEQLTQTYTHILDTPEIKFHAPVVVSNSSSYEGFAEVDNTMQYRYFDFSNGKVQSLPSEVKRPVACALSRDGKYLLVIGNRSATDNKETIFIIDLVTKKLTYKEYFVDFRGSTRSKVIYNHEAGKFNIITVNCSPERAAEPNYIFYTIDPALPNQADKKAFTMEGALATAGCYMHWSCINGDLVGVYTKQTRATDPLERSVVIYTGDELLFCSDPQNNNQWVYTSKGSIKNANFFIAEVGYLQLARNSDTNIVLSEERKNNYIAIEKSFIPDFEKLVLEKLKGIGTCRGELLYDPPCSFDPFTLNCYKINAGEPRSVQLRNPFSFNLIAAIRLLENAGPALLATAYFLYQLSINPATWHIQCQSIFDSVLPDVKKLYNITKLEPRQMPILVAKPTPTLVPAPASKTALPVTQPSQQSQGWGSWFGKIRQNAAQLWNQPTAYVNSIYTRYKDNILKSMAMQKARPATQQ